MADNEQGILNTQMIVGFLAQAEAFDFYDANGRLVSVSYHDTGIDDKYQHLAKIWDMLEDLLEDTSKDSSDKRGRAHSSNTLTRDDVRNVVREYGAKGGRAVEAVQGRMNERAAAFLAEGPSWSPRSRAVRGRGDVDRHGRGRRTAMQRAVRIYRVVRHIPGVPG